MDIIQTINGAIKLLDDVDNYEQEIPKLQSEVDSRLSDLYHYIENNKLKTNQCYRIVQEIHKLRRERRNINNDHELLRTLKANEQKIINTNNRKMLMTELRKTEKRLNNQYINRVYTEEEIKKILGN